MCAILGSDGMYMECVIKTQLGLDRQNQKIINQTKANLLMSLCYII